MPDKHVQLTARLRGTYRTGCSRHGAEFAGSPHCGADGEIGSSN
jgi:hypothetical protein